MANPRGINQYTKGGVSSQKKYAVLHPKTGEIIGRTKNIIKAANHAKKLGGETLRFNGIRKHWEIIP